MTPDYQQNGIELYHGDCLEIMPTLAGPFDAIICDLPYGTTACRWDTVIPFESLWENYKRLIKPNGAIVLFGIEPFSSMLRLSNLKWYRYDWIWNKRKAANFLFGNKQPMKITELISVFYRCQPTYNPEKRININGPQVAGRQGIGNLIKQHLPNCPERSLPGKSYEADKLLPTNILEYSKPSNPIHPTQKPVDLLAYLIHTYTQPGEIILDNTMGSGTTGVACVREGRRVVGIEKEREYFDISCKRIRKEVAMPKQLELLAS